MHQLLHRHLFFSLLALCLLFTFPALAQCPATITVQGRTVLCQGETTTLVANSGSTAFSYQWIRDGNDLQGQTGSTLADVSLPGVYQVRVTSPSCPTNTSPETEIIVNPRPNTPNFIFDPTTIACSGTPITFSVNAPQADVVYTWDMGDGSTRRGATVVYSYNNVRGVGAQPYTVQVLATNTATGCESELATRTVQVNRLPEISFTEKDGFNTCLPDTIADEDISVTAEITNTTQEPYQSDIRSYTVDWGDGSGPQVYQPGQFNNTTPISNPAPYTEIGDYEIVITALAGNGCTETFTQTYSVSKKPEANFSLDDKKRAVESQIPPCIPVIVTPTDSSSGGGLSYKWSVQPEQGWELESGTLESADPVFLFTVSGVYEVELIVENSCGSDTTSQSIVVGWPQLQLPPGGVFCGPTTIDYSSSGPTGGGGGNAMFIDKNLGENLTGTITITGPKSTTYSFNSDVFQFQFNFDVPGRYLVTAVARNECGSSNDIYMGQPPPPVEVIILKQPAAPTIQNPGIICEGETVTLTPTGPGPIYAWFESNDPNAVPFDIGPSFTTPPLPGGTTTYFVAAVDTAQGVICVGPTREITVQVNPRIANNTIEGDASRNVCRDGALAQLRGSMPTGGNETYSYTWLSSTSGPASGFSAAPGVNNTQHYTPPGTITTTTWFRRMVRSASCSPDTSDVVEVIAVDPVPPSANTVSPELQEVCAGDTPEQLVGSRPTGGAGEPYAFLWEVSTTGPNAGFSPAPGQNAGENYVFQGPLTVDSWFRRRVISGGCTSEPSAAVKITVSPRPAAPTLTVRDARACENGSTTLAVANPNPAFTYRWYDVANNGTAVFEGASFPTPPLTQNTTYYVEAVNSNDCASPTRTTAAVTVVRPVADAGPDVTIIQGRTTELRASGGATYQWTPTAGLSNPNASNPVASPDQTTTYMVTATTPEGCVATDEVTVTVTPAIIVPNAFSPNGDAVNEVWEIDNIQIYPNARVEVFNRWGNKVFSSTGYAVPWDGRHNGQELPVATYYYVIYLTSSERPISGNVTIIR